MIRHRQESGHLQIHCWFESLTHLPLVPHICVNDLGHHWFRKWLVACSASSHYLNQCWLIVNWAPGNIFQWNLNRNSIIFIQENENENVISQNGGHFVQEEMQDTDTTHTRIDLDPRHWVNTTLRILTVYWWDVSQPFAMTLSKYPGAGKCRCSW